MIPDETKRSDQKDLESTHTRLSEAPWHRQQRLQTDFQGPYQDDSTFLVFCGLRTFLARFLLWYNLPFCWIVGGTLWTGHAEKWLDVFVPGPKAAVAIAFVVVYLSYMVLAHTFAVWLAIRHELWWNPYARAPTLKGKVGSEEEAAMLGENRLVWKRAWKGCC